jgi:hypothetical protein
MIEPAFALGIKLPETIELDSESENTPFPIETFPLAVQEFCEDVGRVTLAPIEFSASLCLGVLSACLGKGVVIPNAFKGMRGLPTLQIALALESGTGKTAVSTPVLAPLVRWCKEQREIDKAEQSSIIGQIKLLEKEIHEHTQELKKGGDYGAIQRQVIEKQTEIDQLKREAIPPVYRLEDATLEALVVQLGINGVHGQEAVFSVSDDARQAISTLLGRYTKNGSIDDNLLVKGFSWSPHQQHRRSEGGSVELDSPCVGLLWCIQPDLLHKLLGTPELLSSGFLQRLILLEIDWPAQEYTDLGDLDNMRSVAWDHLLDVLLNTYRLASNPLEVSITDEAKRLMIDYYNSLVPRVNDPTDLKDVRSSVARWAEWAWRVALVFHVVQYRKEATKEPISQETAQNAISLTRWYADRKLALLAKGRSNNKLNLDEKIIDLAIEKEFLVAADLQQAGLVRTASEARAYLDRLVATGNLVYQAKEAEHTKPDRRTGKLGKGGPVSHRYILRSKVITHENNAINANNEEDTHAPQSVYSVYNGLGDRK